MENYNQYEPTRNRYDSYACYGITDQELIRKVGRTDAQLDKDLWNYYSRNKNSKDQETTRSNTMGDPEYAEALTPVSVLVDGVDSVQPVATDADVGKPVKRKRLLSDKQREALQIGRERRWKRAQEAKGVVFDNDVPINDQLKQSKVDDTVLRTAPTPEPRSDSEASSVTLGSQDTSSDESDYVDQKTLKRKVKKAKKEIPKEVRKRLDKYLKAKMDEHLYKSATPFDMYPEPPVLQRQQGYYQEKQDELPPYNGPFAQPLKYL